MVDSARDARHRRRPPPDAARQSLLDEIFVIASLNQFLIRAPDVVGDVLMNLKAAVAG